MEEHEGGGASRSTESAAGSSAATDVSLREFFNEKIASLDRHLTHELASLRRESQVAIQTADTAAQLAKNEADARLLAHNGLIQQMRDQGTHFATRESLDGFKDATDHRIGKIERFQAMLIGGMILISSIGVANLVKIWSG